MLDINNPKPAAPLIPQITFSGGVLLNSTAEDALKHGATQAEIDAALAEMRRDAIKAECARRIYAVASAPTQQNMAAATAVIAAKAVAARSEAEKGILVAFEMSLGWVQAMRAAVTKSAADPVVDHHDDANWPACPPEVVALANSF